MDYCIFKHIYVIKIKYRLAICKRCLPLVRLFLLNIVSSDHAYRTSYVRLENRNTGHHLELQKFDIQTSWQSQNIFERDFHEIYNELGSDAPKMQLLYLEYPSNILSIHIFRQIFDL